MLGYVPPAFWAAGAVAAPSIVEFGKQEITVFSGTISLTFAAAQAGDFLCVNLVNVTHSSINVTSGWTGPGSQESSPSGTNATHWIVYKVAAGGETSFAATLASGTGMKSAVFVNVRGSDGVPYSFTRNADHTLGALVTAPVLSSIPAGALAFSVFAGGDDALDSAAQFTCTVGGSGWTELVDACSNIASQDQGGVTVATNTGTGTLAAGTGTFSRSVKGHIGGSFYLKS